MPDPIQLAGWLGCATFIVLLVNGVLKITDRFKERPSPAQTYVTKEHCHVERGHIEKRMTQAEADIRKLGSDIAVLGETLDETSEQRSLRLHERIDSLRMEMKQDVRGVHERSNDILAAVSRLEGRQ